MTYSMNGEEIIKAIKEYVDKHNIVPDGEYIIQLSAVKAPLGLGRAAFFAQISPKKDA